MINRMTKAKSLSCLLLSILFAFSLSAAGVWADGGGDTNPPASFGTKEARLEDDETTVAINIETQCLKTPKVLVYQGTFCIAHDLSNATIVNGINSILSFADVDYYAEAKHYSKSATAYGELKHFERDTTITENDIYKVNTSDNGMHIVTQNCLDRLIATLDSGDYDYLVMILDGAMCTGLSGGSSAAILNEKLNLRLTDEQYVNRRAYAEKLQDINILYLVAPKATGDILLYFDNGSSSQSYTARSAYWDEKYKTSSALAYWNAHLFVEGLAFLAPGYYLTITDPATGKITCTTPPKASEIPYDKDHFVYYNKSSTVAASMSDIKKAVLPVQLTITDVLAAGLVYKSASVEYSADKGVTWQEVDKDLVEITKDDNTLKAKIDLSDETLTKSEFRVVIKAEVTDAFGETVQSGKTNGECTIEYENGDGEIIEEFEPESPEVTFTTFDVYYQEGDHGTLTGKDSETFRKYATNNQTTGSSVTPDQYYIHTGWTCDDDVVFTDGTTAAKGTLLSDAQIANVVPTHTITFTAQYTPETRKVDYIVIPDPTWGTPEDSVTPAQREYPVGSPVVIEENLETGQHYAADSDGNKVKGRWEFIPWDTEDFVIYEDTTVTGEWVFTPVPDDPVTPPDEPVTPPDEPAAPSGDSPAGPDEPASPDTGDSANMLFALVLMAIGLAGIRAAAAARQR